MFPALADGFPLKAEAGQEAVKLISRPGQEADLLQVTEYQIDAEDEA